METPRRTFLIGTIGFASGLAMSRFAFADAASVSEADPMAGALGYKTNAAKVDKTKYSRYAVGQACGNCGLFQGTPNSTSAPCSVFTGKQVAAKGWCSAYSKRA
ncbi:high potential iron-sulfur protein [Paraburkholderia sp. BL23I1N1]|uniref:high-potential iron-sulfur protein n=1 Tax=unclassified Paraburkholderia TaxID=2615204 RepID=UPI000E70DDC3|nr:MULTISPECIES: high-potential iron-sulfur protein [unclassified Paraburkholderia]RKE23874.1 high potential iron-sulfur protein [Paraburkholderia sp. BL23I1N1]TDY15572.1 high potential iron-sulfur protein [Paraburkholderia sp. BL6665CI2N2]